MNKSIWIIVSIGIIILGGMYFQSKTELFSILPAGQYSAPSDCSFITNVNPYNGPWNSYVSGAYITMDINSDGTKEKFGYSSTVQYSTRGSGCGGQGSGATLKANDFNSQGDDIYHLFTGGQNRLYVCQADGTKAKYFIKDCTGSCASQIANAIIVCTTTCTPSCSGKSCGDNGCGGSCGTCSSGLTCNAGQCISTTCTPSWTCSAWSTCSGGTQTRTCTDSNNCGTNTGKPATSQSCTSCNTDADINCNGIVEDSELLTQITKWINSQITRSQLGSYIMAWSTS